MLFLIVLFVVTVIGKLLKASDDLIIWVTIGLWIAISVWYIFLEWKI